MFTFITALSVVLLANQAQARFGVGEAFGLQGKLAGCGLDSQSSGDLGGAGVGILLAAPDPCTRYVHADKIVEAAKAQNKPDCIDVAREFTNAEKNFNPFASAGPAAGPRLCDDPNLPVSPELKGILPLIDPAVEGSGAANQKATETLNQAKGGAVLDNGGKSVQQQMLDIGFNNFFVGDTFPQPAGGAAPAPDAAADANIPPPAANNVQAPAPAADANAPAPAPAANDAQPSQCQVVFVTVEPNAPAPAAADNQTPAPAAADNQGGDARNDAAAPAADNNAGDSENLQKFDGAELGIKAPAVTNKGGNRPFQVEDNNDFTTLQTALNRSCDVQHNKCSNAGNAAGQGNAVCGAQLVRCKAANNS